ncbi:hypothetical protein LOK49_LG12G00675 [Camellia lanceoleosa]|uniref:Uncharacterized protein n=1 Tax=Camellia lanceoleosa TaxID=1840588 RepID=A0ACC0FRW2_9ERIC|nr:hypothetical protein LOK49_LG12G00675 [Camellia lanceoleosa]
MRVVIAAVAAVVAVEEESRELAGSGGRCIDLAMKKPTSLMADGDWVMVGRLRMKDLWEPSLVEEEVSRLLEVRFGGPAKHGIDAIPIGNGRLGAIPVGRRRCIDLAMEKHTPCAVYGTYEAIRYKVPGLLKIRYIGQTTLGSAAIFGLFLGAGSLIHCGKSY